MGWYERQKVSFQCNCETGQIEKLKVGDGEIALVKTGFPLLELVLLEEETRILVTPQFATSPKEMGERSYTLNFLSCQERETKRIFPIEGVLKLIVDEKGEMSWSLALNNQSSLAIIEILFPRTMSINVSPEMVLMYPHHAGERIVNIPQALASEKYQQFWRAESRKTEFGFEREINYCGLASMTWMDLSGPDYGLYVGSHDPDFPITGIRIETGGPENPWVSLSFRKYVQIPPGSSHCTASVVWAFHKGDWHLSAHRYRAWFDTVVSQETHPADLLEEVVVSPHYSFKRHEGITYRFADIPAIAQDDRKDFGSRHFLIAGWNHMGFDSHYPNYNPDLDLGTPLVLKAGVDSVNNSGGFATFYINARIMDKYSEYRQSLGEEWILRTIEQKPIEEQYGPAETVVLCPSHPDWQDHLRQFAIWMCQAYGARGIYYDQLGSATPYPCYSPHKHGPFAGSANFNRNYLHLIESTHKGMREVRKDSFLMIENCGDIYSSKVWGSLAWNGPPYDEFFNLYKYTFPEHTLVNMVNPRRIDDGLEQETVFYQDLTRAFLLGSVFWLEGNNLRQRPREEERRRRIEERIFEALAVRYAAVEYLKNAVFEDNLGLGIPHGVQATSWRLAGNQGGFILAVNDTQTAQQINVAISKSEVVLLKSFDSQEQTWVEEKVVNDPEELSLEVQGEAFSLIVWHKGV